VLRAVGERLAFVHDRVREVAYAGLLRFRRKLLHCQVAETLESLHAEDLTPKWPRSVSTSSTGAWASAIKPTSTSPPPRRCIASGHASSDWSRPRGNANSWAEGTSAHDRAPCC
jgi:hypothetical protein